MQIGIFPIFINMRTVANHNEGDATAISITEYIANITENSDNITVAVIASTWFLELLSQPHKIIMNPMLIAIIDDR